MGEHVRSEQDKSPNSQPSKPSYSIGVEFDENLKPKVVAKREGGTLIQLIIFIIVLAVIAKLIAYYDETHKQGIKPTPSDPPQRPYVEPYVRSTPSDPPQRPYVEPYVNPTPTPDIKFIDGYKCSNSNYNTANEFRDRLDRLYSELDAKRKKIDDMERHYDHLKTLTDIACSYTDYSDPGCKSRRDEQADYLKQWGDEIASRDILFGVYESAKQRYNSFLNMNCELK